MAHDEAHDEFASYFNRETTPKVLITMTPKAKMVWRFKFGSHWKVVILICRIDKIKDSLTAFSADFHMAVCYVFVKDHVFFFKIYFQMTWKLCFELKKCIPNSEIYSRKNVLLKKIVKQANEQNFTDLIIVSENMKQPSWSFLF